MPVAYEFDFCNPDYQKAFAHRLQMLEAIRSDPDLLTALKAHYAVNPIQFINDWGCTYDPRNADVGLPSVIPFVLFDRQEEWLEWVLGRWQNRRPGLSDKSRDVGLSWMAVALGCTICLFRNDVVIGYGSRKEEYVDKLGFPRALFWKARKFLEYIPQEFLGGFSLKRDAPHMRVSFPGTGSVMVGESGDGIGRGDRTSLYFVDESSHLERPELIEASLSATTNCRIDMSSAKGLANPFAQKIHDGKISRFTFHWRDDPRKRDDHKVYELVEGSGIYVSWYEKQKYDLDEVTLAQEVDINYSASVDGVLIPSAWVSAAVDAAEKLNIEVSGARVGSYDVADGGRDKCAYAARYGIELFGLDEWSGKGSDTLHSSERVFRLADQHEIDLVQWDIDGMGPNVRGDSRAINERRKANGERVIEFIPFRGSGEIIMPERDYVKGRKNKDYFKNRKAQEWFSLRDRFKETFRALNNEPHDKNKLISLSSKLPFLSKLMLELSQPTYSQDTSGKMLIDKSPANTRSPNLADSVMMVYATPKRVNSLFMKRA